MEQFYKQKQDLVKEYFYRFIKQNIGKYLAVVEYYDDTSLGYAMEQGDLFKRIPHVVVSHH